LNPSQLSPSFNFFTAILFHHKIEEEQPWEKEKTEMMKKKKNAM
jgi:hypothetical protein